MSSPLTHRTLMTCGLLTRCGCHVLAAHAHGGVPVVRIDAPHGPLKSRPTYITPTGRAAILGAVRIEWATQRTQRTTP